MKFLGMAVKAVLSLVAAIYFLTSSGILYALVMFGIIYCSRSKLLTKLLKTFDKDFREIFPGFIDMKRRAEPSAFFDNNFVNNAYSSAAVSPSSPYLASSSSKVPISSRMTCLCL